MFTFHDAMSSGNIPRVHGNGFIQLDLSDNNRLHIWGHRDLPRQKVDTGIHNHRFSFLSVVIRGRIVNALYTYEELGAQYGVTHIRHTPQVREGEDTILRPLPLNEGIAILQRPEMTLYKEGESYQAYGPAYHETFSDRPSATIIRKTKNHEGVTPEVLVPVGQVPDNDFNRNAFPEEMLWGIIRDVLG